MLKRRILSDKLNHDIRQRVELGLDYKAIPHQACEEIKKVEVLINGFLGKFLNHNLSPEERKFEIECFKKNYSEHYKALKERIKHYPKICLSINHGIDVQSFLQGEGKLPKGSLQSGGVAIWFSECLLDWEKCINNHLKPYSDFVADALNLVISLYEYTGSIVMINDTPKMFETAKESFHKDYQTFLKDYSSSHEAIILKNLFERQEARKSRYLSQQISFMLTSVYDSKCDLEAHEESKSVLAKLFYSNKASEACGIILDNFLYDLLQTYDLIKPMDREPLRHTILKHPLLAFRPNNEKIVERQRYVFSQSIPLWDFFCNRIIKESPEKLNEMEKALPPCFPTALIHLIAEYTTIGFFAQKHKSSISKERKVEDTQEIGLRVQTKTN
jgi:hypothetical protein